MTKQTFIMHNAPHPSRRLALEAVQNAPEGTLVTLKESIRTDRQNDLIQPLLREWADKVNPILVNGEPTKLGMDDWRHILVAKFRQEAPRYALFDGALILLGASSKSLSSRECSEFVEYLHAEAGMRGFTLARVEATEDIHVRA